MEIQYLLSVQRCNESSKELYNNLINEPRLKSIVSFGTYNDSHCFQIRFKNHIGNIHGLSISYPPDINIRFGRNERVIETITIDEYGELYYDEYGECDLRRYNSIEDLIKQILKIALNN